MKKDFFQFFELCDLPLMALGGAFLGSMVMGMSNMTLGAFFESESGSICNYSTLISGIGGTLLSLAILGVMTLYYILIVKKKGVLFPSLNGFGLLMALMTFYSGAMLTVELMFWIQDKVKL